ncbi:hypothetical protein TNCV_1324901 [Trichonephila clavipes]|nr:hypothetical protein TNCV_1324901 [Trichonephila clavipes]
MTMEKLIDGSRNTINNYKENGHDASSFLIQDQFKTQEHYEQRRQQLVSELSSLPPCDIPICAMHPKSPVKQTSQEFPALPTPTQAKRKDNSDDFTYPPPAKENN